MSSTFPKSYPYLNPNGVLIEKREVEEVAKEVFRYFGKRGKENGLELARVILWVMEKLTNKDYFYRLVVRVFSRALFQNKVRENYRNRKRNDLLENDKFIKTLGSEIANQIENDLFSPEERLLIKEDFNKLAAITMPLEEIIKADRVKRFREIRKIREILRRLEGVKSN